MKTTIEINGRIYDARTGKIVTDAPAEKPKTAAPYTNAVTPTSAPLQKGVVMDGVSRRKSLHRNTTPHATPVQKVVHSTQKSQTLHRKAVKKPGEGTTAPHIHSTTANVHSRVEQSATGRGMLLRRVPDVRLGKALSARKSNLVTKFGRSEAPKPVLSTDMQVQEAPAITQNTVTPIVASHTAAPIAPIHPIGQQQPEHHTTDTKKFVFEDHISKANSHLLKPVKKVPKHKRIIAALKVSPKALSASAAVFALVLMGGFFAYQNVPAVSMRVAASKAGFEGKLPKNIPSGYAFNGPVKAIDDNISLTYASNSDDRRFIITQRPTNWSSESLLTNYLLESQFRYQAYKDKGLTVYIYNGSNATWVDKGVWFSVNGDDGSLSSQQLLEIASSI